MLKEIRIPGPDHAITIAPTDQRVTVRVGDHVIVRERHGTNAV